MARLHCAWRPCQRGATLTELVIVLAVLALLLGGSLGRMAELLRTAQLRAAQSDLVSDLLLARSAAIQRNGRVVLCKGRAACVADGGWEQGWLVFVDADRNGRFDPGEELLQQHAPLHGSLRLSGNQTVAAYVGYSSLGASKLNNGGFQAGTLTLCQRSELPVEGQQIVINATGRIRTQPVQLGSCS